MTQRKPTDDLLLHIQKMQDCACRLEGLASALAMVALEANSIEAQASLALTIEDMAKALNAGLDISALPEIRI